jgi:hypothetical protein
VLNLNGGAFMLAGFIVIEIILLFCLVGIPAFLTMVNLYNLFFKKKWGLDFSGTMTIVLGISYTLALYAFWDPKDWSQSIVVGGADFDFHAPFSGTYQLTFSSIIILAIVAYFLLASLETKLPPLALVLCVSAMYIGCIFSIFIILQLTKNINDCSTASPVDGYLMCLLPLNYIILSLSMIIRLIPKVIAKIPEHDPKNTFTSWLRRILKRTYGLPLLALIMLVPLVGIFIAVLFVFGQQPDSAIKVFTETSDWLFSTKISPAPIPNEGHYLCTVAAGGHKKIVKPIRYGERRGNKIIVNRQLCIANAFEDLVQKRTPRFHHLVRHIYDTYGYPISKFIRTPLAADITYFIMKPLEWIFLIVLYLFDEKPENRIALQYLPRKDS